MDRKTYFKRKIFEMTDSQSVIKKSCRRKITFEDEMSDISQEPKKQCLELKLLTDANTSTNQPLVSSEGVLSPEIFLNNNLPIANSDVTDKAVIAASEESQIECRQNIITNNSNDENLEETVDISSELQVEDDSNLVLNTNTMTEKNTSSISASNKLSKRSSERKLIKKTYCEFISDNEDPYFTDEFSSWNEKSGNDSNSDTPITKKSKKKTTKKKKLKLTEELDKETTTNEPLQEIIGKPDDISIVGEKGKKIQQTNTRKERKICKNSGKEYIQTNGKIRSKKEIKPNPCVGKKCGNNSQVITEERRLSLFNHFWTLSSERQRDWIVNMSRRITIKRKRSKDSGKRNYSFEYYINDNEDRRKVCQQFILNTLAVSQTYMYYTLSNCIEGSSKEDLRGRHIPANKTKEATKQNVQNFIKKLPALPSHYCRRDTTKLYLPVEYKNHKNLYLYLFCFVVVSCDLSMPTLNRVGD